MSKKHQKKTQTPDKYSKISFLLACKGKSIYDYSNSKDILWDCVKNGWFPDFLTLDDIPTFGYYIK